MTFFENIKEQLGKIVNWLPFPKDKEAVMSPGPTEYRPRVYGPPSGSPTTITVEKTLKSITQKPAFHEINRNVQDSMPAKQAGFNRVLDGLKKRQLQHDFQLERAAQTYTPVQNIGSGAFGIVCEAIETSSNEKVAIKKIAHASATPTLARRTLREIRVLRYIDHPNIVSLRDIFRTKGNLGIDVFLVMDLMDNNLHHIIYGNEEPLEKGIVLDFLGQLLRGLEFLHAADIAHRDLKPSNLLVNRDGTLRIADFGMAKCADKSDKKHDDEDHCYYMTQHVATLPYRAPELLFVLPEHSTAVDMWAVGCIYAEMIIRNEFLPGRSVQGQIRMLLKMLGHPPQYVIDKIQCERTKKLIQEFGKSTTSEWDDLFYCKARTEQLVRHNCDAIDFVKQLFQYDATKRLNIKDALRHPHIVNELPSQPAQSKCPFKVKNDMKQVETLSNDRLTETLREDVRSAEEYKEFHSGDSTGSHSSGISDTSGEMYISIAPDEQLLEDVATQVSICEPTSDL